MKTLNKMEAFRKLVKSKKIKKSDKGSFIELGIEYIQERADESGVSFSEMVEIIENELKTKE